jgi:hypothetical protein
MTPSFADRLADLQRQRQSKLALYFAPRLAQLPLVIQKYDDPFFSFTKTIIAATRDLVCAYVFDLAAYLAIGATGAVALERSMAYASGDALTILHGPLVGTGYATLLDKGGFAADAVTLWQRQDLAAYTTQADTSAFLVQPGAPQPDVSESVGVYWQAAGIFTLPAKLQQLQIRVVEKAILDTACGEDFAELVREQVERLR